MNKLAKRAMIIGITVFMMTTSVGITATTLIEKKLRTPERVEISIEDNLDLHTTILM